MAFPFWVCCRLDMIANSRKNLGRPNCGMMQAIIKKGIPVLKEMPLITLKSG